MPRLVRNLPLRTEKYTTLSPIGRTVRARELRIGEDLN
jgi:hypothetical protein